MQTGTTFNCSVQIGTMFSGDRDKPLLFSADAGQCLTQAGTVCFIITQ